MGFSTQLYPHALWLGAVMTAFIFHFQAGSEEVAGTLRSAPARQRPSPSPAARIADDVADARPEPVNSLAQTDYMLSSVIFMPVILAYPVHSVTREGSH